MGHYTHWNSKFRRAWQGLGTLGVFAVAGCSVVQKLTDTAPPAQPGSAFQTGPQPRKPDAEGSGMGELFRITAAYTPFYSYGPAQSQGPDRLLHKGDAVMLVKREAGFGKVRTMEGMEGYVAMSRLGPGPIAAPSLVARAKTPAKRYSPAPLKVLPFDRMFEEPPLPTGPGGAE